MTAEDRKIVEFENQLSDLITETFATKAELVEAIRQLGEVSLRHYFEEALQYY